MGRDKDWNSSGAERTRPTRDCRRGDKGTSLRPSNCRAATRRCAAQDPCGVSPAPLARALSSQARIFAVRARPPKPTYSAHPASCAAADTVLDILEREHLVERAAEMG